MSAVDHILKELVHKLQTVGKLIKTKKQLLKWIQFINRTIKLTKTALENKNVQNYSKLESSLGLLKYSEKFKHQLRIRKKNLRSRLHRSLMWKNIESCFQKRIRTGVIINFNIKEPTEFLNKASRSFSNKIKRELKKSLLKVNSTFLANFVKTNNGETDV